MKHPMREINEYKREINNRLVSKEWSYQYVLTLDDNTQNQNRHSNAY